MRMGRAATSQDIRFFTGTCDVCGVTIRSVATGGFCVFQVERLHWQRACPNAALKREPGNCAGVREVLWSEMKKHEPVIS